jgi:hypothetical protein
MQGQTAHNMTPVVGYEQVFWFPARFNRLFEVKTSNRYRKQDGQMFISG